MTSHETSPRNPPPWFTRLIGQGLATLYLLSLDGCPAADAAPAITGIWAAAVWQRANRNWHEQADTPCIRSAFASLAATSARWPAPAQLIASLPHRAEPTGALLGEHDAERRRDALANQRRQFRDMGYDEFGQPLPGASHA